MESEIAGGHVHLRRPRGATGLLVLTHGAGGDVTTRDVLAVADAVEHERVAVALVTQPYRVAGRRTPPAPGPQDIAWVEMINGIRALRGMRRLPIVLGGRSNGARVACRTADVLGAVGVLALAFPLHPPGRPDISRLAELESAHVPVLVVQGERDPFGMPPPGEQREIVVVAGADHNLRKQIAVVAEAAARFVTSVVARASVSP